MEAERCCQHCFAWDADHWLPLPDGTMPLDITGRCRRHAPSTAGFFPITSNYEWCLDWVDKSLGAAWLNITKPHKEP